MRPTESAVATSIQAILLDLCGTTHPDWGPDTRFDALPDWDSFRQVEVIVATEEAWGVTIHTGDFDGIATIGDLIAAIVRAAP